MFSINSLPLLIWSVLWMSVNCVLSCLYRPFISYCLFFSLSREWQRFFLCIVATIFFCCSRGSEFKQFLPRIKIYCSVDTVIYRLNFVFTLRFFLFQHFRLYSCTFFPTKVSHSIIYFHTPVALHLIYETVSAIFGIMVEDLINFKTLMDFLLIVPLFARDDASNMSCHGDCKIHVTFTYLISPLYCGYNLY